ncbi:hypothetical protein AA0114_g6427 [Alternaria tenuissima]|uniref:BZIP domain-containing protein n=1 Tax=Alternaria tenuissima TaxID=119927 RepID=A0A4Q4MF84_9PLEO|nr:hypothetical protein AA0114_g6427 [Alternaria tenuissima]
MTAIQQSYSFDWAGDAFTAMQQSNASPQQAKWATAFNNPTSMPPQQPFSIPPSLLTHATMERYGQVTPPEEHSPVQPNREDRERSIPVDELRNETALRPKQEPSPHMSPAKRQRPSRHDSANQDMVAGELPSAAVPQHQDNADGNPQPPKRKRGRPKSQPQMIEAYTADGYPFQVSSARQTHLEKNRVAAHKCRQRKKEYINSLEGRAREFSAKNKMLKENVALLREEVLDLKNEVLAHAGCGFWAIDEYLARCAGGLLGMDAPAPGMPGHHATPRLNNSNHSPVMASPHTAHQHARETSMGSMSSGDADDFGGLELLKDFTDEDMDDLEA